MTATTMITSDDAGINKWASATCVGDVLATVARAERGNVCRLAQSADIPVGTIRSYVELQANGTYRRTPDADRLTRLMAANDEVRAGILAVTDRQQRELCQKRSPKR